MGLIQFLVLISYMSQIKCVRHITLCTLIFFAGPSGSLGTKTLNVSKCLSYYLSHLSDTSECSDTWKSILSARFFGRSGPKRSSPGGPNFLGTGDIEIVAILSGLSGFEYSLFWG